MIYAIIGDIQDPQGMNLKHSLMIYAFIGDIQDPQGMNLKQIG